MHKITIICISVLLLASCQSEPRIENTLTPKTPANAPVDQESNPTIQVIKGSTFKSGTQRVTFADDGTYRYSKNGFFYYARWTVENSRICLHRRLKQCSKFTNKGRNRYGWFFGRGTEFSYEKVTGPRTSSVSPITSGDTVFSTEDAVKFLQARTYKLPNNFTVGMNSNNKLAFRGTRNSSSASVSPKNGELCGNFRIGEESCISVVTNTGKQYLVSKRPADKTARRWIILN